jgi:hypothetical protein
MGEMFTNDYSGLRKLVVLDTGHIPGFSGELGDLEEAMIEALTLLN